MAVDKILAVISAAVAAVCFVVGDGRSDWAQQGLGWVAAILIGKAFFPRDGDGGGPKPPGVRSATALALCAVLAGCAALAPVLGEILAGLAPVAVKAVQDKIGNRPGCAPLDAEYQPDDAIVVACTNRPGYETLAADALNAEALAAGEDLDRGQAVCLPKGKIVLCAAPVL